MASGNTLITWTAQAYEPNDWRNLGFTSGGTYEIVAGDTITGATSAVTAKVVFVFLVSGTWAGGDAAGDLIITAQSAAFAAENLNVGANANVATTADSGATVGCSAALDGRNNHLVLDFDAASNEFAVFSGIMPRHYAGGGVTAYLHYAMTSATTDTVDWDVAWERIGDQQLDIDADSFAAVQSVDNTTVPDAAGKVDIVSIAFTDGAQMDSVAVGEAFRLYVMRDALSDDAAGDAELMAVELKES